ncbi:hypothetical protein HDV00_007352 [Rhizophlyctis rosea]|nr:hypothetical protein HDV00_007352 [Rhizophlyctis rosea]
MPSETAENILVILPLDGPQKELEKLKALWPNSKVTYFRSYWPGREKEVEIPEDLYKDVTILVTLVNFPTIAQAPKLKLVHLFSAGADRAITQPLFKDTSIPFTNSSGVHGPQISEWIIMTLLIWKHKYNALYENQKKKSWDRSVADGTEDVYGKRIGILGYGAIGRQTARVAKSLGMEVYAYTATPRDTPSQRTDKGYYVDGLGDPDGTIPTKWFSGLDKPSLHTFLRKNLDVIVISLPLTDQTRHFLSTEEFEILASHPPLISNIGRGPIIDQPALVKALHSGQVAGAALDVTDPEPLPSDDPLWDAPNVIITPHVSGNTQEYAVRSFDVLKRNLERLGKGEAWLNEIDRRKGY